MLSYGRVAGQLSRISRHAHAKNVSEPYKRFDFISIHCLRFSSKTKKTRTTGATAKAEDCVPKTKSYKKVPPLPPLPSSSPPHANVPPVPPPNQSKPLTSSQAPCDNWSYSCPPECPPTHVQDCSVPQGPGGKDSGFKYWKHLIAAIILVGVSPVVYFLTKDDKDKKEKPPKIFKRKEVVPNPKNSNSIPSEIPYLLIGGGTAAFSAFRTIKARDPTAKVLMITSEPDYPYMRPPLSKELWFNKENDAVSNTLNFKQWNGSKRSLFYEHPEFYTKIDDISNSEKGGIAIATGWTVKKIDALNKTVYLNDDYAIKYDKCLIATGASPKSISVFDKANMKDNKIQDKVIAYRTKEDYLELAHNIQKPETKSIVIIGGGFLGSELSTSLARYCRFEDRKVHQVFKENHILAQVLPEYLSKWATERVKEEGVHCIANAEVHSCTMKENGRLSLALTNGEIVEADQVILAVGVEVEEDLPKASSLELDRQHGGYLVNAELEARNNLWVAGDAACFYDVKLGRRRVEHHDHAVVSGKLAGENMTGARKPYLHQSMFWSDLGPQVGFEAIGIIDSTLETVGVFAEETEENEKSENSSDSTESKTEQKTTSTNEVQNKDESVRPTHQSNSAEISTVSSKVDSSKTTKSESQVVPDDYEKGVVYYLRDNVVVGIVLWNIFNRMSIARQILARGTIKEELNEASKLFEIHEEEF